jgi:hypothetical protein
MITICMASPRCNSTFSFLTRSFDIWQEKGSTVGEMDFGVISFLPSYFSHFTERFEKAVNGLVAKGALATWIANEGY